MRVRYVGNPEISKIVNEYPEHQCYSLEMVYGEGMMSEGGANAIDEMFHGIELNNKIALDVGAGLGGVAFYLAKRYQTQVTGLEINPWLVEESTSRTPVDLSNKVNFMLYSDSAHLNFQTNHFDIIYSKGVLVHLENKSPLFKELYRILKPGGKLIINDWLSPVQEQWNNKVKELCESEGFAFYAVSPSNYSDLLQQAGFKHIQHQDKQAVYAQYNQSIADWLRNETNAELFKARFGSKAWEEALWGYQLIAASMQEGELLVSLFHAQK